MGSSVLENVERDSKDIFNVVKWIIREEIVLRMLKLVVLHQGQMLHEDSQLGVAIILQMHQQIRWGLAPVGRMPY